MKKINLINSRKINLVGDFYPSSSKEIIILSHGFIGDRSEKGRFEKVSEVLNQANFNVAKFDFGGSGESDDEIMTVENEVQDLNFIINHFKKEGFEKIGLLGFSLGGYVTIMNSNLRVDSVVLWNPVSDKLKFNWRKWFLKDNLNSYEKTEILDFDYDNGVRKKLKISKKTFETFANISQEKILNKIQFPLLIIQGGEDTIISLESSKNALNFLPNGSKLEIVLEADHEIGVFLADFITKTLNWFKNDLKK